VGEGRTGIEAKAIFGISARAGGIAAGDGIIKQKPAISVSAKRWCVARNNISGMNIGRAHDRVARYQNVLLFLSSCARRISRKIAALYSRQLSRSAKAAPGGA